MRFGYSHSHLFFPGIQNYRRFPRLLSQLRQKSQKIDNVSEKKTSTNQVSSDQAKRLPSISFPASDAENPQFFTYPIL